MIPLATKHAVLADPFHRIVALHRGFEDLEKARFVHRLAGRRSELHDPAQAQARPGDHSFRLRVGTQEVQEQQAERQAVRLRVVANVGAELHPRAHPLHLPDACLHEDGGDPRREQRHEPRQV